MQLKELNNKNALYLSLFKFTVNCTGNHVTTSTNESLKFWNMSLSEIYFIIRNKTWLVISLSTTCFKGILYSIHVWQALQTSVTFKMYLRNASKWGLTVTSNLFVLKYISGNESGSLMERIILIKAWYQVIVSVLILS